MIGEIVAKQKRQGRLSMPREKAPGLRLESMSHKNYSVILKVWLSYEK
jgi:hypothetical protein